jgi:hypothetical protein
MGLRKFVATTIREYLNENANIGDNTNYGKILDKTDTQYFFKNNNFPKGSWIHKSLVKKTDEPTFDEPLKNRGWISPDYVISAFANPISSDKIEKYSDEMRLKMMEHDFPPIKGYPIIIDEGDIERFKYFLSGEKITEDDLGRYAWVVTDGHHRVVSALNVGLPQLKTSIDYSYVDEKDFI